MKNISNIIKVINYTKEKGLKLVTDDGFIIADKNGYVKFYDRNMTKCFDNAAKWIDSRK